MTNCYIVFGKHAFRKWPEGTDWKNPINRALFESWGTTLAIHNEDAVRRSSEELMKRARAMMTHDDEFMNTITVSTGLVKKVQTRLSKVRELAREIIR